MSMFNKLASATFAGAAAVLAAEPIIAAPIGASDFGPGAYVETFDWGTPGAYNGSVVSNGVTYGSTPQSAYQFLQYDPLNYDCVSGVCLGTFISNTAFDIVFDSPVERVGGYLTGEANSLEPQRALIDLYDANDALLAQFRPVPISTTVDSPAFFGFQTGANQIKRVVIFPNNEQSVATLDNFTYETLAPVPVPGAGAGLPGLILASGSLGLWRRRRQKTA